MYAVVNIYWEPTSDERYATYDLAEVKVKQDWAVGWETYVAYQFGDKFIDPTNPR